jgi:hypothetical protein
MKKKLSVKRKEKNLELKIFKFSIPKGLTFLKFQVSLRCVRGFAGHPSLRGARSSRGFMSLWYPLFSFIKKEKM